MNDGLEQLRRSYNPPSSPHRTATTINVQSQPQSQPFVPQQKFLPSLPMNEQPCNQSIASLSTPTAVHPYGFDASAITALLPVGVPAAAQNVLPSSGTGAPIIQYISSHTAGGISRPQVADLNPRPQTATTLGMAQQQQQLCQYCQELLPIPRLPNPSSYTTRISPGLPTQTVMQYAPVPHDIHPTRQHHLRTPTTFHLQQAMPMPTIHDGREQETFQEGSTDGMHRPSSVSGALTPGLPSRHNTTSGTYGPQRIAHSRPGTTHTISLSRLKVT